MAGLVLAGTQQRRPKVGRLAHGLLIKKCSAVAFGLPLLTSAERHHRNTPRASGASQNSWRVVGQFERNFFSDALSRPVLLTVARMDIPLDKTADYSCSLVIVDLFTLTILLEGMTDLPMSDSSRSLFSQSETAFSV